MKLTSPTASSRAAVLPDLVVTANPDGNLKYTGMGQTTSLPGHFVRVHKTQWEVYQMLKKPQKGLIFHNNALLAFHLIPTAGYFP